MIVYRCDTCGALVQSGRYHHSIKGIRPDPVIKLHVVPPWTACLMYH